MELLNQLREDAGRLAEEAVPEVFSALEQLTGHDALAKVLITLVARLEESVPGLVRPANSPLASPLTTHTPSDEEIAAAEAVPPNLPLQEPAAVTQGPAPVAPVQTAAPQSANTVEQLQQELAAERQKVAALQSAQTPAPPAAPQVSTQGQ